MPLYRDNSLHRPVKTFISITRDEKSTKQNVHISSNHISILDDEGQIIQQIVPTAKILPINLENQQINERTLINELDDFIKGLNTTVLFIGSTFSGKQKLFDGNKNEFPLSFYFIEKLFTQLKQRFRRYEVRMKFALIVKEKIYDCNSENKYTTHKLRDSDWEGIEIVNINSVLIQSGEDFKKELLKGIKQKNKLILEFKDLYTSFLSLTLIRDDIDDENQEKKIVSNLSFFEVPGVQLLSESHNKIKTKQNSTSTKSLFNFAAIISELNKNPEATPSYESSALGLLLKETLCGNSLLSAYYNFRCEDIEGCLATAKFVKLLDNLQQYPIVNQSTSFGLLRKYRAEIGKKSGKMKDEDVEGEKKVIENEMVRLQTEQDYNRLVEKYGQLKNKYNQALKSKSEAQLELIKCEQEKLEIGKSLVEVQIENTKLLEKLQNKDYENGKKMLTTENQLAKREISYQECIEKIQELNDSLSEALETKRDLQVEFIALKRNYIIQQKQITKLKEDNQNMSLDIINISNENERLKKQFINKNTSSNPQNSRMLLDLQNEKYDEIKRQNKKNEETIQYLRSEVDRYKRQMIEKEYSFQKDSKNSKANYSKDYDRIQLENQNMELINRIKLLQRKVEEMEEKVGYYEDQNNFLEEENKRLRGKDVNDTQDYRKKLEQFTKGTNYQAIVKELKENFARKDHQNLNRINSLKKIESDKKKEIMQLKSYMRELIYLLEEWAPKGAEIPSIRKFKNLDLGTQSVKNDEVAELRIKNMKLEEEVRRLKSSGMDGSRASSNKIHESRVKQQYNYLKESSVGNRESEKLREDINRLSQENRRLTMLLKDGNKMDLNIIKKQNQNLRRQIENHRNQSSVSPSTNDQKLVFYEKHLKILQRQRSELLSRCVVAEEQVKNLLGKIKAK